MILPCILVMRQGFSEYKLELLHRISIITFLHLYSAEIYKYKFRNFEN
jgi:hypothetical protein